MTAHSQLTTAETIAEIEWFFAAGVSAELTAKALRSQAGALAMLCRRAGRHDLSKPFSAADRRARNAA